MSRSAVDVVNWGVASDEATDELERNLATVARSLFESGTVEGTLQLAVDLAVATVDG